MTVSFRKFLFWMHLVAGCVAGVIVLVMSVTGVLLTYERQILASLERGPVQPESSQATRLDVDALVKAVRSQRGDLPRNATLTLHSDPQAVAEIRAGRGPAISVDRYTGQVLTGSGSTAARAVFQKITGWHRWLGVEGEGRAVARAITGACNLCFLFLVASGAYLWLPRRWTWQAVRPITMFRGGLAGKARDFNWHNVFGFWALIPLFFIVLTALPMSYPWANDLLYRMTGTQPPPGPGGRGEGGGRVAGERRPGRAEGRAAREGAETVTVNRLWSLAESQVPGWKSITARLAVGGGEPASFTIDAGDGGQPQKRSTLLLDPATGTVVKWETFSDMNAGRRLRTWSRFVHTGEYYGIVGQTVAGLSSLAGVMLVWTGISLALRRFASWKARRGRRSAYEATEPVAAGGNERL